MIASSMYSSAMFLKDSNFVSNFQNLFQFILKISSVKARALNLNV
jgi:hypothetical protein